MMWVSKVPNYDAYGLFRALHSHNPFYAPLRSVLNMCHRHIAPQYSHIVGLSSHFYAHMEIQYMNTVHFDSKIVPHDLWENFNIMFYL